MFAIRFARLEQFHQRDRQPFFVKRAGIAAHGGAADIHRVAGVGEICDAASAIENGRDDRQIKE